MTFSTYREALAYARSLMADMHGRNHKAVRDRVWTFCRTSGDYSLVDCWHVILA